MSRIVINLNQLLELTPNTDAGKVAKVKLEDALKTSAITSLNNGLKNIALAIKNITGNSNEQESVKLGPVAIQNPDIDYDKQGIVDVDLAEINCLIRFNFLVTHTKNGGYAMPIGHIVVTAVRNQHEESIELPKTQSDGTCNNGRNNGNSSDSDNNNNNSRSGKLKYKVEENKLTEYLFNDLTGNDFLIRDPNNGNNIWTNIEDFILVVVAELWPKALDYVNDRFN